MSDEETQTISTPPETFESFDAPKRKRFLRKARRLAGKFPFVRDAVAMYFAVLDNETPLYAKAQVLGAIAYFVLPIDLIPDVIVGLGYTDDAGVILATLRLVQVHIKPRHYQAADAFLEKESPQESA